jgi:feruloyl esterase
MHHSGPEVPDDDDHLMHRGGMMTTTSDRSSMTRAGWMLGACLALIVPSHYPAVAQSVGQPAATACENLASMQLPNTRITMSQRVEAGAFVAPAPPPIPIPQDFSRVPAFCRVAATITPVPGSEIKIEVWLPSAGWNGKFVGVGNGGFSGAIWYMAMAEPLQLGYAVAATNTGHDGDQADASFAVGHPERMADFAWRAVNQMTVKAKAIITAHYGRSARHAYWVGCSTGGRQGLKEAQRFPADYDGIVAGAPANNWVPLMAHAVNVQRTMTDSAVGLTPRHLGLLKTAAIAACDAKDGVTDKVVEDPRNCAFDPGTVQCKGGETQNCLSARQVAAVRSLYAGVRNPRTGATLMPGPTPGGEPAWMVFTPRIFPIGVNFFRDLIIRDAGWNAATFDLDRDVARAFAEDNAEVTTMKSNLSEFIASGGKLLLWHGWTDAMIPAKNTVDYYESVLTASGRDARNAVRLFMVPGVDHCSGGEGTFVFDALQAIDAWVKGSQAPDRIVAQRPMPGGAPRTRPLCAYPQVARYRGTGSTDDERNFECGMPVPD